MMILDFIKQIIDLTKDYYNINKVYVLGMSNGGMMAQALACEYPYLFAGVVNVVGMQHLGLSCTPESPVNFILYGGKRCWLYHQSILNLMTVIIMSQWRIHLIHGLKI